MQEKISIKNSRGLKLAAILHKPAGFRKDQKYPAVIVLHGFTGYKEEEHIAGLASDLEKNGFVAIRFDTVGFGESEGTLVNHHRFSNYLQDTEDIFKYLKKFGFVDKNRIGITGQSWGGKMAVIFAAHHPEVKAVVSISAAISLRKSNWLGAFMQAWKQKGYFERISSKYGPIKIPYEVVLDDEKFDPVKDIALIKCPLLVVLGLEDDTVLPKDTRAIYEAANEPKKMIEIKGMNHDYKKYPDQVALVNREVVKFFTENL